MSVVGRVLVLAWCCVVAACSSTPSVPTAPTAAPHPRPPEPVPPASQGPPTWDVDARGVPRFITHHYIDLDRIAAVSKFRSGQGHDYSDAFEHCRSMKHYYRPSDPRSAGTIAVFAPMAGRVVAVIQEWAGVQIVIASRDLPAWRVVLFHTNPSIPISEGTLLEGGQVIGTHIGDQTWSDVAVAVDTPQGFRLVSWFDAISDEVFARYGARGLASRDEGIITRAERDADPLTCAADGAFAHRGRLEHWVLLR